MTEVTTIGLDLTKHVFQVHGADETSAAVVRKRLRRGQVHAFFVGIRLCSVGMEACPTAHRWARELKALGHVVRLMPPQYVKAYAMRNPNLPHVLPNPFTLDDAIATIESVTTLARLP